MADAPYRIYRKRPLTVEAVKWPTTDPLAATRWMEVHGYPWLVGNALEPGTLRAEDGGPSSRGIYIRPADGHLMIRTLEGDMAVMPGDYIIRGVKGEFYPCKPGIFEATYESVTTDEETA